MEAAESKQLLHGFRSLAAASKLSLSGICLMDLINKGNSGVKYDIDQTLTGVLAIRSSPLVNCSISSSE
jgi:hypothetical protein